MINNGTFFVFDLVVLLKYKMFPYLFYHEALQIVMNKKDLLILLMTLKQDYIMTVNDNLGSLSIMLQRKWCLDHRKQ